MAERASVFQVTQIGPESTPGTQVPATKRLSSWSIEPKIATNVNKFRPQGSKWPTVVALGKEWTEATLSGSPTYQEIGDVFASVLAKPSGTGPHVYSIDSDGPDIPQTFTVECGAAGTGQQCESFTHAVISSMNLSWNREAFELSGDMIGRAYTTLAALSTVTPVDGQPILPGSFDFYLSDDVAGETKLTRCFSVDLSISGRWNPVWAADSTTSGFLAIVEAVPEGTIKVKLEADAQGMGLLTALKTGTTKYFKMAASGSDGAKLEIVCAVKVGEPDAFEDEDGVYAIGWELQLVNASDLGSGSAIVATVTQPTATP